MFLTKNFKKTGELGKILKMLKFTNFMEVSITDFFAASNFRKVEELLILSLFRPKGKKILKYLNMQTHFTLLH